MTKFVTNGESLVLSRPLGTLDERGPATDELCIAHDAGSGERGAAPGSERRARTVPYLSGCQLGAAGGQG